MSIKISYSNLEYQTKYGECRKNLEAKTWIFFRVRRVLDRGTRQTQSSPCARHMAHGEDLSSPCAWLWHTANNDGREAITRSLTAELSARHVIHVRRVLAGWHTAKRHVRRVLGLGTRRRARFAVCLVFTVCFLAYARHIICLSCARKNAHGKDSCDNPGFMG